MCRKEWNRYLVWRFWKVSATPHSWIKFRRSERRSISFQIFCWFEEKYIFIKSYWQIERIVYNKNIRKYIYKKIKKNLWKKKKYWFWNLCASHQEHWPDPASQRQCDRVRVIISGYEGTVAKSGLDLTKTLPLYPWNLLQMMNWLKSIS